MTDQWNAPQPPAGQPAPPQWSPPPAVPLPTAPVYQPAPAVYQPQFPPPYYQPRTGYATGVALQRTSDQRTNMAELVIAWILTVLTFAYFLPWAIAATRGKSNSVAIALINFLLGWTLIGWIIALVMACGAHQHSAVNVAVVQSGPYGGYPAPGAPFYQPPTGPPGGYPPQPPTPPWVG